MSSGCELTVLMPCLNEAETLAACIRKAKEFIADNALDGEILIADNGSIDGSIAIAEELGARVVHVTVRGYGAALTGGIEAARGRFVIMGDADDSYDFSNLMPFVQALRSGADLVMGNRFRGGVAKGAMPLLHRYLGNPVLSYLGRLFYRTGVGDFHCGLRGFSREAIQGLRLSTTGMEFASEMVVKACLADLRLVEVPTTLRPDGRSRPPHLRTWRDGWRHLRFLLLYSPRWLFLIPGFVLLIVGLASMFLISSGAVAVGGLGLDIHTLSYSGAAVTFGVQMILFAMITKLVGSRQGWLPVTASSLWLAEKVTLERCLALGAALLICGLAVSFYAVADWAAQGFGPLDPRTTMRWVIPSVTMLAVGGEIGLSAFVFEALRQSPAAPPKS